MKRFRKTFFTVIISLLFAVSSLITVFAEETDYSNFRDFAVQVIADVTAIGDEELDMTIENYKDAYPGFAAGLESWKAIKSEAGEFTGVTSYDVIENGDGSYKVNLKTQFTGTDCDVSIGIGADGYITAFSFEKPVTMKQLIKDAFSNLVVGMGTVFILLIFLSFVIGLFKYISIAEKKFEARKAAKKNKNAVPAPVTAEANNRTVTVEPAAAAGNDDEIQAVIAAAIAAYEAESGCRIEKQPVLNNGITVKSYRRK